MTMEKHTRDMLSPLFLRPPQNDAKIPLLTASGKKHVAMEKNTISAKFINNGEKIGKQVCNL